MSKNPDIAISLQNVTVRYKKNGSIFRRASYYTALNNVSLDIYRGETLGIVGGNGAGKSTLLKLISGIITPDKGIVCRGDSHVALLSLNAGFDPNLSGKDNALLSGMLQGLSYTETKKHLVDIADFAELGEFFYEPVRTYSSGMRTRLGFAISTIITPDVLLIDEVLSVGDEDFRKKAEKKIIEKTQSDKTVIIVSHSKQQISRLCDRKACIINGSDIIIE